MLEAEALTSLWHDITTKAKSREFVKDHDHRIRIFPFNCNVNLTVVAVHCWVDTRYRRFRLYRGPDAIVGFELGPSETEPLTLRVEIGGVDMGDVRVVPGSMSFALQDTHCIPIICIDAAEVVITVVDRPEGLAMPDIRLVEAHARNDHRMSLSIFRSDSRFDDRPVLHVQLIDRAGDFTNGKWKPSCQDQRTCSVVHVLPPARDLRKAAETIRVAYVDWKWRKDVLWNPHTPIGHLHLLARARWSCASTRS